jgi:hypothetical protein
VRRASRIAFVVTLVAAQVATVVTLQRLGRVAGFSLPRHGVRQWVLHAPTEDLLAVAARLLALALTWWLLAATVLSTARRVVPGWRRLRALDSVTPAALRRALDRALALGFGASLGLASVTAAGATAAPGVASSVTRPADAPRDAPVVRSPAAPTVRAAPRRERVVIVRAGDNFWVIARRAVATIDATPGPAEIAPYWRRVVAANTGNLRSHDPDLIFPGERVVLPALSVPPRPSGGPARG